MRDAFLFPREINKCILDRRLTAALPAFAGEGMERSPSAMSMPRNHSSTALGDLNSEHKVGHVRENKKKGK